MWIDLIEKWFNIENESLSEYVKETENIIMKSNYENLINVNNWTIINRKTFTPIFFINNKE